MTEKIDVDSLIDRFRSNGHRITKVRRAVVEFLAGSKSPLSAQDFLARLKKRGLEVNKTTIYREIDFLLEQKIVREIDLLEGKKRYELILDDDHHHHVVCLKCKAIQCVSMEKDLDMLEKHIFSKYDFKVTSHTLEFFGFCGDCR